MLHLNFAPSLDMLMPKLAQGIRTSWNDPFDPPTVLVPSPALGKWLQMRLADGNAGRENSFLPFASIANLHCSTIEKFLWNTLQPTRGMVLLEQHHLVQIVCALLDEATIHRKEFAAVARYLVTSKGIDPAKRVQLATRIAHQFIEYEYNRPGVWKMGRWEPEGVDGSWMRGRDYFDKENSDEVWQRELYCMMRGCFVADAKNSGEKRLFLTLPQRYRMYRECAPDKALTIAQAALFLFGVTKLSHFHRNVLVEIAETAGVELQVFITNPCAEFWEDVDTRRTRTPRRSWNNYSSAADAGIQPRTGDDYGLAELNDRLFAPFPPDHPLLELWGNAGKENIFLWCQDASWNFDYHAPAWVEEELVPESNLAALQYSLLRRESTMPHTAHGRAVDRSLRILACPDRGREIEELREQMLDCIHDGTVTFLNEMVVYLPDPTLYAPHIERVFGRYTPGQPEFIPFTILGGSGKSSLFVQGVELLLDVLTNSFDRAHLFELLRNPIVQATRGIAAETVTMWESWAAALSMYRGYNKAHREAMGDTGSTVTDLHTFTYGINRILCAELAEGAVSLSADGVASTATELPIVPYHDFSTSDRDAVELFCRTLEELYSDSGKLDAALDETVERAVEMLTEIIIRWLGTIPEETMADGASETGMQRLFLETVEIITLQQNVANRSNVNREEFLALVRGCLPAEKPYRTNAWTGGVTFAPLRASTIVPHPVIFAAGLDAAAFPGSNDHPSWDLLARKRIVGDSDKVRDNRFAFLELLHAARKRCILSYRAYDMQKEEELQPASVLLELESYLRQHGFCTVNHDKTEVCSLRHEVPWIVHEAITDPGEKLRPFDTWNPLHHELAKCAHDKRVADRYVLATNRNASRRESAAIRTTCNNLSRFFANPLEYHLARTLGIDGDEVVNTSSVTDEPCDSGTLALSVLQKNILTTLLRSAFPIDRTDGENLTPGQASEIAERLYATHVAEGEAPEGMFEKMERQFIRNRTTEAVLLLHSLRERFTEHILDENSDCSLGRSGISGILDLGNNGIVIECRHPLVLCPKGGGGSREVAIISIKNIEKPEENHELWCAGVLQWLFEKKNLREARAITLVHLNPKSMKAAFDTLTEDSSARERIEQWLTSMIDAMDKRCSDHFPFKVIAQLTRQNREKSLTWEERWGRVQRSTIEEKLTDEYGYRSFLPAISLVDATIPEGTDRELRDLAKKRFAPLIEGWLAAKGDRHE